MRKSLITQLILIGLLLPTLLISQAKRPKIGYAFGGGGAKGLAEIGVCVFGIWETKSGRRRHQVGPFRP